jgi:hypothetical protein
MPRGSMGPKGPRGPEEAEMTEFLAVDGGRIAYGVAGLGPPAALPRGAGAEAAQCLEEVAVLAIPFLKDHAGA